MEVIEMLCPWGSEGPSIEVLQDPAVAPHFDRKLRRMVALERTEVEDTYDDFVEQISRL